MMKVDITARIHTEPVSLLYDNQEHHHVLPSHIKPTKETAVKQESVNALLTTKEPKRMIQKVLYDNPQKYLKS